MSAPLFERTTEITDMIKLLMDKREDLFGDMKQYVYNEMFVAGLRCDKEAPKKQKNILKIEGIRGSRTLLSDAKWLITGFKSKWNSCSYEQKLAAVANILRRVEYPTQEEVEKLEEKGKDYEYGKTRKPDVEEWKSFIEGLGVDWNVQGKIIPDIVKDDKIEV
jgi:hypothetical protein